MLSQIIFDGQTGADQGALDVALELKQPCGGWCPKGRKSESGPIPDEYPVQEHSSSDYKVRTKANVEDSDGTLIFTYGPPEGGTGLTVTYAKEQGKLYYIVDLDEYPLNKHPEEIWQWGWENVIFVLNIAGPREGKIPDRIHSKTCLDRHRRDISNCGRSRDPLQGNGSGKLDSQRSGHDLGIYAPNSKNKT